jgi:hypothetical protein
MPYAAPLQLTLFKADLNTFKTPRGGQYQFKFERNIRLHSDFCGIKFK